MAFWMKTKQMLEADLLMECEICAERMEVRDQMSMPGQLWTAYTQPVGFWVSLWCLCWRACLGIGMNSKPYIHPSSNAS